MGTMTTRAEVGWLPGGTPWSDLDLVPEGALPVVPLGPLPELPGACAKATPATRVPARAIAVIRMALFIDFSFEVKLMSRIPASRMPAEV
jgi:hypothetical protein